MPLQQWLKFGIHLNELIGCFLPPLGGTLTTALLKVLARLAELLHRRLW